MKRLHYIPERGSVVIKGARMEWTLTRSRSESAFGIRGSRIFELTLTKNGAIVGVYERGWKKQILPEDEESSLCLSMLIDKYGRDVKRQRKEMGYA